MMKKSKSALMAYNRMYLDERAAHPSLPAWAVKQIVKDHLHQK